MQALSASDVLEVVEWGTSHSLTSTALYLLDRAGTGLDSETLAALPLGTRDRLLLRLYGECFAGPIRAREACPECGAELEVELRPADLALDAIAASGPTCLQHDGVTLRFRPTASHDLLAIEGASDEADAARALALRCIETAQRGDTELAPEEIGDETIARLGEAMALADPQADLTLDLACADCGHRFGRSFDIARVLVDELVNVSRRIFCDVHALARGYGFSEAQILGMSAWRRQAYLEMLAP